MKGIAVAGTLLADRIKTVKVYPKEGELAEISGISLAGGGLVHNVGADIKKLSPDTPVYAYALVGDDFDGEFLTRVLTENGVDCENVKKVKGATTSFTDVYSVPGKTRTFFTCAGASSAFGYDSVVLDTEKIGMLHLGYFLLLDKIDGGDGIKILKSAVNAGIKTSIDLVSKADGDYAAVLPALKYVDNLIINEVEAERLTGIPATYENAQAVTEKLLRYGVRERVIIHAPAFGACASKKGFTALSSFDLPKGFIVGTNGAGDAYTSGALVAINAGKPDEEILKAASYAATVSLTAANATGGVTELKQAENFCKNLKRRKLC